MTVDIRRHIDVGMCPIHFCTSFRVNPAFRIRLAMVPQLVKADMREAVPFQQVGKPFGYDALDRAG